MKRNGSLSYALGDYVLISNHLKQLTFPHSHQCGISTSNVYMCTSVRYICLWKPEVNMSVVSYFLHDHPFTFTYFVCAGEVTGGIYIYICYGTQKGNRGQFWVVTFFLLCAIHYQSPDTFFFLCLWSAKTWATLFHCRLLAMTFCLTMRPHSMVPSNHGLLKLRVQIHLFFFKLISQGFCQSDFQNTNTEKWRKSGIVPIGYKLNTSL